MYNAPRDGLNHVGAMVGTNPFWDKETSRVPVVIVPMIITTHTVATGINPTTLVFSTAPGDVTQNSGEPQTTCLTAPNNVPSKLIYQSPIFQSAPFTFGGVFMGNTQYIDAYQRANFYQALGGDPDDYHVLLSPVRIVSPIRSWRSSRGTSADSRWASTAGTRATAASRAMPVRSAVPDKFRRDDDPQASSRFAGKRLFSTREQLKGNG